MKEGRKKESISETGGMWRYLLLHVFRGNNHAISARAAQSLVVNSWEDTHAGSGS